MVYCEQIEDSGKIEINLQNSGCPIGLDRNISLPLYRIAQELIQNVLKHSQSTRLSVQLRYDENGNKLFLLVEDNGVGYNAALKHTGLGLKNIQERVKVLGGHIFIESGPDAGTTVLVEIDLPAYAILRSGVHLNGKLNVK